MRTTMSKEIGFDAGHRVPGHRSKCRHPHGHRYRVIAYCTGDIVEEAGAADEGMLVDFGDLKKWMTELIHDVLDHGFIVYEDDQRMRQMFDFDVAVDKGESPFNIIVFPYVPTAENIARWCWEQLLPAVNKHWRGNLELAKVEVWETPTSMATYGRLAT